MSPSPQLEEPLLKLIKRCGQFNRGRTNKENDSFKEFSTISPQKLDTIFMDPAAIKGLTLCELLCIFITVMNPFIYPTAHHTKLSGSKSYKPKETFSVDAYMQWTFIIYKFVNTTFLLEKLTITSNI